MLITADGLERYSICRRLWWLADVLGYARSEELVAAQAVLERRLQLSRTLATVGGVMIGLAILLLAIGLVVG